MFKLIFSRVRCDIMGLVVVVDNRLQALLVKSYIRHSSILYYQRLLVIGIANIASLRYF